MNQRILSKWVWGHEKNINRQSIMWNMMYAILSALQPAIYILFISRMSSVHATDNVSVAFAYAYLLFTVGTFGVRNYHISDVTFNNEYSAYAVARVISMFLMVMGTCIILIIKSFPMEKTLIILLVCLLKGIEVYEDLFHGELQRQGRLDVAGRLGVFRLVVSYIVLGMSMYILHNPVVSIGFTVIVSGLLTIQGRLMSKTLVVKSRLINTKIKAKKIVFACFPLFISMFLNIYVCNAAKYSIDKFYYDGEQTMFAILSMPVFAINLLSGMIYRPQLVNMATMWNTDKFGKFTKYIASYLISIVCITFFIVVFGDLIGMRLLEIIYTVSLKPFRIEFTMLLIGGGLIAVANFSSACLTIMRKQDKLAYMGIAAAITAVIISDRVVRSKGVTGAAIVYFLLMLIEAVFVLIVIVYDIYKESRKHA